MFMQSEFRFSETNSSPEDPIQAALFNSIQSHPISLSTYL